MSCTTTSTDKNAIQAAKDLLNSVSKKGKSAGSLISGNKPTEVKLPTPKYTPPVVDDRKHHEDLIEKAATDLVDIERSLSGGTQILTYTHDLQVVVGGEYVSSDIAPPIMVGCGDPVLSKVSIKSERTHFEQQPTPFVQSVTHPIPWGNYNVIASHKYNIIAGAGGAFIHTDGCIDINSGARTTISSLYELNLTAAKGNLNVICGNNVQIKGDTVTLRTAEAGGQVVVDSNLGVTKDITVHGGIYVDGELYCQNIVAPAVVRETQQVTGNALLPPATTIGYVDVIPLLKLLLAPVTSFFHLKLPSFYNLPVKTFNNQPGAPTVVIDPADPIHFNDSTSKQCYVLPHSHTYYTINSQLHSSNAQVRDKAAKDINNGIASVATEQTHGGTGLEA